MEHGGGVIARDSLKKAFFLLLFALCALPGTGTAEALAAGILFSLLLGNPWPERSSFWSVRLLQLSVALLGFGLSLGEVLHVGKSSAIYTAVGISLTLLAGKALGSLLKTRPNISSLISFGTAICGGSAIAALAPVIRAGTDETAIALATVFTLNSAALILFPAIGHILKLSQHDFGVWAGLAIHDTSSVVGAAAAYGTEALRVGTVVKLSRAVWVAPIAMAIAWFTGSAKRAKLPAFIVGFMAAAALSSLFPQFGGLWRTLAAAAKQGLVMTLFLIGAGLSRDVLRHIGLRPLAHGAMLWLLVSSLTLAAIINGLIH